MKTFGYILLFLYVQLFSLTLFLPGVVLIAVMILLGRYKYVPNPKPLHPYNDPNLYHFKDRWMWIWDNEEDGLSPIWYLTANPRRSLRLNFFVWSAFRNHVNNLRFVPGISAVGRPLWLKTFMFRGKQMHVEAGWLDDGYPTLNLGYGPW